MPKAERRELGILLAGALFVAACAGVRMREDAATPPSVVPPAPARGEPACPVPPPTLAEARLLVDRYCVSCHAPDGAADDVDFRSDAALQARRRNIEAKLTSRAMPPPDAPQPTDAERAALRCWAQP